LHGTPGKREEWGRDGRAHPFILADGAGAGKVGSRGRQAVGVAGGQKGDKKGSGFISHDSLDLNKMNLTPFLLFSSFFSSFLIEPDPFSYSDPFSYLFE
jgi:hypothetical protein